MDVDKATQTQLENIQKKTGKTLDQLFADLAATGLTKHGELRDWAIKTWGIGHGDGNAVVHFYIRKDDAPVDDPVAEIYVGPKEGLKPIHTAVMALIEPLGEFEIAPKKGYVSLRRKKQFAMLGPATNSRVELGLNMKGVPGTDRLLEQPAGGMCQYKVKLTTADEVDAELAGWIKTAFDSAG